MPAHRHAYQSAVEATIGTAVREAFATTFCSADISAVYAALDNSERATGVASFRSALGTACRAAFGRADGATLLRADEPARGKPFYRPVGAALSSAELSTCECSHISAQRNAYRVSLGASVAPADDAALLHAVLHPHRSA